MAMRAIYADLLPDLPDVTELMKAGPQSSPLIISYYMMGIAVSTMACFPMFLQLIKGGEALQNLGPDMEAIAIKILERVPQTMAKWVLKRQPVERRRCRICSRCSG